MVEYQVFSLERSDIEKAIQVFAKAMNFTLDVEVALVESTKMFFDRENFLGIIIKKSGTIVAFAGLIPMSGNTSWIPYVGVDPAHQGKGLGGLLMENLIRISQDHNWRSLELVASKAGFPVYKKYNFRTDYPVASYEIKSIKNDVSKHKLDVLELNKGENVPVWVQNFDESIMGINRSGIFPIHTNEKIILISKENEGYAIIYGKRIGPVIAKTKELAKDLIIKGFSLDAETVIFINEPEIISFFEKDISMEIVASTATTKMSFGEVIQYKKDCIFGLRSKAYG